MEKMKSATGKNILLSLIFIFTTYNMIIAQNVGINTTGATANSSALLDVDANNKGLLLPRMTTVQRSAIASPAHSLLIFNTTSECFEAWNQTTSTWVAFGCIGCQLPGAFTASAASGITATTYTANWTASAGATNYFLDISTVSTFATFVAGYNNQNVGNSLTTAVIGLTCNTTYYYRLRANNACGTSANSNTISLTTSACPPPGPTCGTQVWASINLSVGTMINGSLNQTNNGIVENYCYNNVPANCSTYGGLYQWNEAMNYATSVNCDPCGSGGRQGQCPAGYHIPTDLEWSRYEYCLENILAPTGSTPLATFQTATGWRGSITAGVGPGSKMKTSTWGGTNTSGFALLPAGQRNWDGTFFVLGTSAKLWSATENVGGYGWHRQLIDIDASSSRDANDKINGYSVRCLQN